MGYEELRKKFDPEGHLAGVPDEGFLAYVADHQGGGVPSPWEVLPGLVKNVVQGAVSDAGALVTQPFRSLARAGQDVAAAVQGKRPLPPTPEEVARQKQFGAAAAATVLPFPGATKAIEGALPASVGPFLKRLVAGGAVGAPAGALDATLRGNATPQSVGVATGLGAILGGVTHGVLGGREAPQAVVPEATSERALGQMHEAADAGLLPGAGVAEEAVPKPVGSPGVLARSPLRPLASVEERLRQAGPSGERLADLVKRADDLGEVEAGKVKVSLQRAGFGKLSAAEDAQVHDAAIGKLSPDALSPRARSVFEAWDAYRQTVLPRAKGSGLQVILPGGERVPLPEERANYFPQHPAPDAQLKGGKVRQAVVANLARNQGLSPEAAAATVDDYLAAKAGKKGAGALAAQAIAKQNDRPVSWAMNRMRRGFLAPTVERSANVERARLYDNPFYDPSPSRQFVPYIENTEHRIAEATHLGPNNENADALVKQLPEERRREAERLARLAVGAQEPQDAPLANLLHAGRHLSSLKLGPFSALRNLTQSTNTALRADLPSLLRGGAKALTKAGGETAMASGAASEHALHNVAHQVGAESGFLAKWLKGVGFTQSEQFNRRVAANVGAEYTGRMARRLVKNPADAIARAELADLGVSPDAVLKAGGASADDLLVGAKRFTDQTQFRSRPLDLPAMASDNAVTQNAAQFKTFSFQQGRLLAKETLDRLRSGDPKNIARGVRNLAILATVFPAAGEVVNDIEAAVTGKKRPGPGVQRWLEDLQQTGGAGLGSDVLQSAEFGKGDKGGSLALTMAGPTLSTAYGLGQTAYDIAKSGGKVTDPQKRYLLRTALGGLGTIIAPRVVPYKKGGKK